MEEKYMLNKSNVDVAFDIVKEEGPIAFNDLWKKIVEIQSLDVATQEKLEGSIYTQILLDGRFINVGDNTWDLRTKHTFEEATLDTNECYTEEEDDDEELDPEEKEDLDEEETSDKDEEEDEDEESENKDDSEFDQ
jgi:DNA-directed RNA polymerase subunit delta